MDSGNLAGHLLTLRQGLLALVDAPILNARSFDGMGDTFSLLIDAAEGVLPAPFAPFQQALESASTARPATLATAWQCLDALVTRAEDGLRNLNTGHGSETHRWAQALAGQCRMTWRSCYSSRRGLCCRLHRMSLAAIPRSAPFQPLGA